MVRRIGELHQSWDAQRFGLRSDMLVPHRQWLSERAVDPRSVFVVAEADAVENRPLVAYLVGSVEPEIPIYWQPETAWIHDLWVDEAYRHEGVGRQMTMLAIERFTRLGIAQIRLHTAAANAEARALFSSCGFRPCVVEMMTMTNAAPSDGARR
jgi:ribosomal protein S18 acetylase RimI-like enzyme